MIFRQVQQVLDSSKTQTRRVVKPNEFCTGASPQRILTVWSGRYDRPFCGEFAKCAGATAEGLGRCKWVVGRTYAVCPGRGKHSVGRIKLLEIRRERVQDITGADAQAEGCIVRASNILPVSGAAIAIDLYSELWDSINPKKGDRWEDNPLVWVLMFEKAGEAGA